MMSCGDYDQIELVCIYAYPIKLSLNSGLVVEGIGLDIIRNNTGEESLRLKQDRDERLVVLASIATLEICVENPHFEKISFTK